MRIGVVFPQTELGGDVGALRAYAHGVEELGFRHVMIYDHVLGADPAVHQGWDRPYNVHTTFHEPLVVFGFLAALTRLELVTGVVILPQRQTALAAKQAAEVDLLTEGRFRFGVGVGWNQVEYEALGEEFSSRGRRFDEQIELLRRLWTEQSVTHNGAFDTVTGAGISPLPVQRPIPVWIGARSAPAYRRLGRLGDGWFPQMDPGAEFDEAMAIISGAAVEAGRDPAAIGLEPRASWRGDVDPVVGLVEQWKAIGASHMSINTMGAGLAGVDAHLEALTTTAKALGLGSESA